MTSQKIPRGSINTLKIDLKELVDIKINPQTPGDNTISVTLPNTIQMTFDERTISLHDQPSSQNYYTTARCSVANNSGVINIYGNGIFISSSPQVKTSEINILLPNGLDLDGSIGNMSSLSSQVIHQDLQLRLNDSSKCSFKQVGNLSLWSHGQSYGYIERVVGNITGKMDGQASLQVGDLTGGINLNLMGQARCNIQGDYTFIQGHLMGQSSMRTQGTCRGDYTIHASGMSEVKHTGSIMGHKTIRTLGLARVE